jgi:hypothetical protein
MATGAHARARPARERWSARRFLGGIAAIVLALVIGALATGGTYALWNAGAGVGGARISAGTAALSVSPIAAVPTTALYPGLTIYGTYTVSNTGDAPLAIRVASLAGPATPTAFSAALTVSAGLTSAACTTGVVLPWSGTFAAAPAGGAGATAVPAHGTATLCVAVTLPQATGTAARGLAAASFTLVLDGVQP